MGGGVVVTGVVLLFTMGQGLRCLADLWVAVWADGLLHVEGMYLGLNTFANADSWDGSLPDKMGMDESYVSVMAIVAVATTVFCIARVFAAVVAELKATQRMHDEALAGASLLMTRTVTVLCG